MLIIPVAAVVVGRAGSALAAVVASAVAGAVVVLLAAVIAPVARRRGGILPGRAVCINAAAGIAALLLLGGALLGRGRAEARAEAPARLLALVHALPVFLGVIAALGAEAGARGRPEARAALGGEAASAGGIVPGGPEAALSALLRTSRPSLLLPGRFLLLGGLGAQKRQLHGELLGLRLRGCAVRRAGHALPGLLRQGQFVDDIRLVDAGAQLDAHLLGHLAQLNHCHCAEINRQSSTSTISECMKQKVPDGSSSHEFAVHTKQHAFDPTSSSEDRFNYSKCFVLSQGTLCDFTSKTQNRKLSFLMKNP